MPNMQNIQVGKCASGENSCNPRYDFVFTPPEPLHGYEGGPNDIEDSAPIFVLALFLCIFNFNFIMFYFVLDLMYFILYCFIFISY